MKTKNLARRTLGVAVVMAVLGLPAWAQAETIVNPTPTATEILDQTKNASGVFVATDTGDLRHVQSGMVCPISFPNLHLWALAVFVPDGSDIGCDYGRNGKGNVTLSKLSLYATRAAPGDTVDTAFARYQSEVHQVSPSARVTGPAVTFTGSTTDDLKNVRSEEYDIVFNGRHFQSDLIVVIKNGWVIEVRGTSPTQGTADEAAAAAGDQAAPVLALIKALTSLDGKGAAQ